jgi:hypothetical protein
MLFDQPEYAAPVTIRWPARVATIGVVVSLMAVTGDLWYRAVQPPCPFGTFFDLRPFVTAACVAMAVIEGVSFLLTRRPPRSRLVGFAAAVVLAVAVLFVVGEVLGLVQTYFSYDQGCWNF